MLSCHIADLEWQMLIVFNIKKCLQNSFFYFSENFTLLIHFSLLVRHPSVPVGRHRKKLSPQNKSIINRSSSTSIAIQQSEIVGKALFLTDADCPRGSGGKLVCIETSLFVPPDDFVLFQQPPPGRGKNCLGLHTRAAPGIGIVLSRGLFLAVPEPEAPIRFLVDDKYLQIAHPTLLSSSFWRDGISSVVAASSGRVGVGALWWSFWCRERTLLSGVKYYGGFSNGSL